MRKLTARPSERIGSRKRKRTPPTTQTSRGGKRRTAKRTSRRASSRIDWQAVPWRSLSIAVVVAVLVSGVVQLWSSGRIAAGWAWLGEGALTVTARSGFVIEDILVEGRTRTSSTELLDALALDHGDPIFGIDPDAARARVEAIDWVESATVERRLPNVIFLRVVEREPVALWQSGGAVRLIDAGAVPIPVATLDGFEHLLLVVGETAPASLPELLDLIGGQPDLRRRIAIALRVGDRRWDLRLHNGVEILLPEHEPARALAALAEMERDHGVLGGTVGTIDLRLPERMVVLPRGEMPEPPDGVAPQSLNIEEKV